MSEDVGLALALHDAFRRGDLEAMKRLSPDPASFPNGHMPMAIGPCLEYAIYHSPVSTVRRLLEMGAETRPAGHGGVPPLIAAMAGDAEARELELVELLLEFGADPDQPGMNDYTALHVAVANERSRVVDLLLKAGADPDLRTRIDDLESPRDLARRSRSREMVALLANYPRK